MYNYFKKNRNVLVIAGSIFIVSLTILMFSLTEQLKHIDSLDANVLGPTQEHETESDYRNELGQYDGPLAIIELGGKLDFISDDLVYKYGLDREEMRKNSYFTYIHPADMPDVISSIARAFETGNSIAFVGPFRMKVKKEEYSIFIASFYPIKEEEKITKIAVLLRDITEEMVENSDEAGDQ